MLKNNVGKYFNASLALFMILFILGLRDENRHLIDNEAYLLCLLSSTINMIGAIGLYAYHLRTQD